MEHKEFIQNAIKTESVVDELNIDRQFLIQSLELFIETTEVLDAIKKQAFYNNPKKLNSLSEGLNKISILTNKLAFTLHHIQNGDFSPETVSDVNTRIAHGVIGIATESGELVECFYNALINNDDIDTVNLIEELFDGDWYKAVISDELDIDWNKGWETIIEKLKARFGDKFSEEKANNRDVELERKILEK